MRVRGRFIALFVGLLVFCSWPADTFAQSTQHPPEGFDAIFNGKDLEGWYGGETRDPSFSKGWGEPRWSGYTNQLHEAVAKHWRIENGELIGNGAGPDLVCWGQYSDFEMWIDWKVSKYGESGISLRHQPGVALWDTTSAALKQRGANKGSGGLSQNKRQGQFPSQHADQPTGQWNRMYIRMVGPYITVILNDKKVLDNIALENAYAPGSPIDPRGSIHLRTRGGEVRFRNIAVRELSDQASNTVLNEAAEDENDFMPLLNGKDLSGWIGTTSSYELIEGGIRCKRGGGGYMITEKQYRDFVVRLEIKLPPGGNNGLAIRAPGPGGAMELQVLDDPHKKFKNLKPDQYHGSAYGIKPAYPGYLRTTGQWNYQEVYVKGDHIRVVLNGYEILNVRLKEAAPNNAAAMRVQGHFGFISHNDPVAFRKRPDQRTEVERNVGSVRLNELPEHDRQVLHAPLQCDLVGRVQEVQAVALDLAAAIPDLHRLAVVVAGDGEDRAVGDLAVGGDESAAIHPDALA